MNIRDLFVPFEDELQLLPSKRVPAPPLIEWTSAFGDFFFREKGADPQILWCDLGYTVTPKRPLPPSRRATLAKRVSRAFNGRTFFRVVPFEEDWLLVRPKRALVKSPLQNTGASWQREANFEAAETQLTWLKQPQSWFKDWLEVHLTDEDLIAARQFAFLTEDEREWLPFIAPPELLTRWKTLVYALQVLETAVGQVPRAWRVSYQRVSVEQSVLFAEPAPDLHTTLDAFLDLPIRALRDILRTQISVPVKLDYSQWRAITPNGERCPHSLPRLRSGTVSHHERLEAALLWRDFAREIGREDEIEPLLRELMG